MPSGWTQQNQQQLTLVFIKLICFHNHDVTFIVKIKPSLELDVTVCGQRMTTDQLSLVGLPRKAKSLHDLYFTFTRVSEYNVCKGNSVKEFMNVITEETQIKTSIGKKNEKQYNNIKIYSFPCLLLYRGKHNMRPAVSNFVYTKSYLLSILCPASINLDGTKASFEITVCVSKGRSNFYTSLLIAIKRRNEIKNENNA